MSGIRSCNSLALGNEKLLQMKMEPEDNSSRIQELELQKQVRGALGTQLISIEGLT